MVLLGRQKRVWCILEKTTNNPGSRATREGVGMNLESQGERLHWDPQEMMGHTEKVLPPWALAPEASCQTSAV